MRIYLTILLIISINSLGCAAAGVPITFNPAKKLWYAQTLFDENDRPLPAQYLIEEAIEIYKNRNDEIGLADAYRTYAFFLQSNAVAKWDRMNFFDKTVTHENRFEKAVEYWNKAISLYEGKSIYDRASNCYFNIAKVNFFHLDNKEATCKYLTKSLQSQLRFKKDNPAIKTGTEGYSSFEDFIEAAKTKWGIECSSQKK